VYSAQSISVRWRVAKNALEKCVVGAHFSSLVLFQKIHLSSTVTAKVKQVAELIVGVLTQCIKARTMQRMNVSTCSNILLKVNSKLNGVNHALASVSK
jgi:hypothetical protein